MNLKKLLSALTAFTVCFGCFAPVFAADTESDPSVGSYDVFSSDEASIANYSVSGGYTLSSNGITYGNVGVYNVISNEKLTGEDFMLSAMVRKSYNWNYIYINYIDSKNYTEIGLNNPITVKSVVNGEKTDIYSTAGEDFNEVNCNVSLYRESRKLKLVINDKTYFEDVEDVSAINGRYGVRFEYCPCNIRYFKVSNLLHITDSSLYAEAVHGISSDISLSFDYPIDTNTMNSDNVYIADAEGNKLDLSYTFSQTDENIINISFNEPLQYDAEYKLVLSDKIYIKNSDHGFASAKELSFHTEPYPFRAELKTEQRGDDTAAWIELENNYFSGKEIVAIIGAENAEGRLIYAGLPERLTVSEQILSTKEVLIPSSVAWEQIVYFVWDVDMHRAFPEPENFTNIENFEPDISVSGDYLRIVGNTPSSKDGAVITFVLSKPNEAASLESICEKAAEVICDENGDFSIEFSINDIDTSAQYTYLLGGDDFEIPYRGSFYYASASDKNSITKSINAICADAEYTEEEKTAAVSEILEASKEKLTISLNIYSKVSALKAAELLVFEYEKNGAFDETDAAVSLIKAIDICSILAAYNEGLTDVIADAQLNFINTGIYSFSDYDIKYGTSAAAVYEMLTYESKQNVLSSLINKSYTSLDEVYEAFLKNTVLFAIKGYSETGYTHIRQILEENAAAADMEIPAYLALTNTSAVDSQLITAEFSSLEELEAIILDLTDKIDPSVISYDFEAANKDINYTVLNPNYALGAFNGTGLKLSGVSTMGVVTNDKYAAPAELALKMNYNYNQFRVLFACESLKNYCYIEYGGSGNTITVNKIVNGSQTAIATVNSPVGDTTFKNITTVITLKPDCTIDVDLVYSENKFNIFKDLHDEAFGATGGFGGQFINCPGTISLIQASFYPSVVNTNITDTGFSVNKNAAFEFNYALNPQTVNADSVSVYDGNGNSVAYEITLEENTITLDFSETLQYKTYYTVKFGKSIELKNRACGMLTEEEYTFKTENPKLDITELYAKCGDDIVYTEDMSISDGSVSESLKECAGKNIDVYIKLNNETEYESVFLAAMLVDAGGKPLGIETAQVRFSSNTGFANSDGTISEEEKPVMSFEIPSTAAEGCRIKYIAVDSKENMNLLYPYSEAEMVTIGSESPEYTFSGDAVCIFGASDAKRDGNYVSIMLSSSNGEVYYISAQRVSAGGVYNLQMKLNFDTLPESGDYTVSIGGAEMNGVKSIPIYIALPSDKESAVKEINNAGNAAELLSIINKHTKTLHFDSYKKTGTENPFNVINKQMLADIMLERVKRGGFSETDNGAQINEFVLTNSAVCVYNQSLSEYLYDSDNRFMLDDIFSFSEADKGSVNAYSIYESNLTDSGKEKVRAGILGGSAKSKEDMLTVFIQQVVIASINNFKTDGHGHIREILLNNAEAAGIDISKYVQLSDTSDIDIAIVRAGVTSINDINNILKNVKPGSNAATDNQAGVGSGSGSSGGSSKTPNVSVSTDVIPTSESYSVSSGFEDLIGFEWAVEAVGELARRNIVSGRNEKEFDPSGNITREEFAKMLVLAFDVNGATNTMPFYDVASDAWYYEYVKRAYSAGIIKGVSESEFGTGRPITRQDAAVMLYRVLNASNPDMGILDNFSDNAEIAAYAREPIAYMVVNGIINGVGENKIAPAQNSSRAQIAAIIYRIIK